MPAIRRNTAPSTIQAGAAQIPAQRELKVRMGMSETWFADYDETIPPGSTFSAGQWAQMKIEADLLSEQTGKQYTTLERSEEHTPELQSLMRHPNAGFSLQKTT